MSAQDKKIANQNVQDVLSLTPLQEGMLYHYLHQPENDHYFEQLSLLLQGNLNLTHFQHAWEQVIRVNELLRGVFRWEKLQKPLQVILKKKELPYRFYDLTNHPLPEQKEELRKIQAEQLRDRINIRTQPFSLTLIQLHADQFVLLVEYHHILCDGWSMGVILQEFFLAYHQLSRGQQLTLVQKTPFKEFVKWLQKQTGEVQKNYWRLYLEDVELKTPLPGAHSPKESQKNTDTSSMNERYTYTIDPTLTNQLERFCATHRITPATLFYTGWGLILQRYNNLLDVVFGATVSGRSAPIKGIENMVGLFINTIPVRLKCGSEESIETILKQMDGELKEQTTFSHLPLLEIQACSSLKGQESLFDSILVMENYPLQKSLAKLDSQLTVKSYQMRESTHYPLTLAIEMDKEINIQLIYDTTRYSPKAIQHLGEQYGKILAGFIHHPQRRVKEIEILSPAEKKYLLNELNLTETRYPKQQTVADVFKQIVLENPNHPALRYQSKTLTYRQLYRAAMQLAHSLNKKGVAVNQIVGILAERSMEMIIGIWGVLLAGGTYMPLAPAGPMDRNAYMLEDSQSQIILAQPHLQNRIPASFSGQILELGDEKLSDLVDCPSSFPKVQADDLAYVIYTSGTTGKPKGTLIPHRGINRLVKCTNYLHVTPEDRMLQLSNYIFDGSVFDIFGALLNGATLVLVPKETLVDLQQLIRLIQREKITQFLITTALFNALVETITPEQLASLASVQKIYFGGEKASAVHVQKASAMFGSGRLVNLYGPTESTVVATYYPIDAELETLSQIPIGKPISNTQIYVLNHDHQLQPTGGWGELCLGGDGVASGYLHRPDLTAEKFITNPFGPGKLYRTGDVARWREDGNLEFGGRIDQQVQIRGYRIELSEIETQLLNYDPVQEGIVLAIPDDREQLELVAYFTAKEEVSAESLQQYLQDHLPTYMIPGHFIQLPQLPLTSNGKVDTRSLPKPIVDSTGGEYVAPRNTLEKKLATIWSEVLGVEKVGIDDQFFELGGHSLKATILAGKIHRELDVEIPLKEIFAGPTIRQLAQTIQKEQKTSYVAIEKAPDQEVYPTSAAQKRMFMLQQYEPDSTRYHITGIIQLEGKIALDRIKQVFQQLIQRHEALRTSFLTEDQRLVQKVAEDVPFEISHIDKEHACRAGYSIDELVQEVARRFIRPFDLARAPLLRLAVMKWTEESHFLILDLHHSIADGTSMGILIREFAALYAGENLQEPRLQYRDYAVWQDQRLRAGGLKEEETYWLEQLGDELPVLQLPTDKPNPVSPSFAGETISVTLGQQLVKGLQDLAKGSESTIYMVLMAAFHTLLVKYSGQEDILLGTPIANRSHPDLHETMGMFVNTLVIRNQSTGEESFLDLLARVKENVLAAFVQQEYPFDLLIEALHQKGMIKRDHTNGQNPLFNVMFGLQNMELGGLEIPGLSISPYPYHSGTAKFDLTLLATEKGSEIDIDVEYSIDLFKKETIFRMMEHFQNILNLISNNPHTLIMDLDMLNAREKWEILHQFNQTSVEYPREKTIHELFVEQVAKSPESIAVVDQKQNLTYQELNQQANTLAAFLTSRGIEAEEMVAIWANPSVEMLVGILATLKAGGAYLPIDPTYPEKRMKYMLKDGNVRWLIMTDQARGENEVNCQVIRIQSDEQLKIISGRRDGEIGAGFPIHQKQSDDKLDSPQPGARNLAYVIYTSGSTGHPKGVMVEHQNVIRLVKNPNYITFVPGEKILQTGTLAFDASTFEIWGALLNGLELHLGEKDLILDTDRLANYISKHQISIMWLTAPLFALLAEEKPEMFRPLRYLLAGGDILSVQHVNKVRQICPKLNVINGYGPTENTTFSACFPVEREYQTSIPIGKPISNSTAYIVDPYLHLTPVGVYGELWVGGDGVARGYLNNPELTSEKFLENPFVPGERVYRTGDLVRWLADGTIEFLGRVDHQVKIRGFRIEPGEIENHLLEHAKISEAIVLPQQDAQGNKFLVAYFTAHQELLPGEVKDFLLEKLPGYMIPDHFLQLAQMPLTRNGKIDRKALPTVDDDLTHSSEYIEPRTQLEKNMTQLWIELLEINKVGIRDNFFDLGGHSLKAALLGAKIQQALQVKVPLKEIFQRPTIEQLATYIERSEKSFYAGIKPLPQQEYYQTSPAQKRVYMLQSLDPENAAYNIPSAYIVQGELELPRLKKAFERLIQRHESLRTSFLIRDDQLFQQVHSQVDFQLDILANPEVCPNFSTDGEPENFVFSEVATTGVDLANEAQKSQIPAIDQLIQDFIRPFDLTQPPLFRVQLVRLQDQTTLLLFDIHHLIADGISMGIFVDDLLALYAGQDLESLPLQYRDVAHWLDQSLHSTEMTKQKEYWLGEFVDEIPRLHLPTDASRPAVYEFAGDTIIFSFEQEMVRELKELAQKTDSTLFMVLLSAFTILLAKYSGQEDLVVGSPIAGRPHADMEKIIGMFVNTLAFRNQPRREMTYRQFLSEVRRKALEALQHQDLPFEELVRELNDQGSSRTDLSRNPLFDVFFSMQNMDLGELTIEGLQIEPYPYQHQLVKFDLSLTARELEEGMSFYLGYSTHLFNRNTVVRMAEHFRTICTVLLTNPDQKLGEIQLVTEAEKQRLLYQWNETERPAIPKKTIQQIFEGQVDRRPDQVALIDGQQRWTYQQVNAMVNLVAHRLRAKGVGPETIVGLCIERSLEMVIGILGILKAGGGYLPISIYEPQNRLKQILRDSGARLIITSAKQQSQLPQGTETFILDEELGTKEQNPNMFKNPEPVGQLNDLAYVIYTSGSTGKPKGVVVEQAALINTISHLQEQYSLQPNDRMLQSTVYTFDASLRELFWWFFAGCSCYLLAQDEEKNPYKIVETIAREQITMAKFVPILLQEVLKVIKEWGREKVNSLRYLFVGGEALTGQVVDLFFEVYSPMSASGEGVTRDFAERPQFINVYGPSEGTVHCSEYLIDSPMATKIAPIGKPIRNMRMYILDEGQHPTAIGIPGELYISGIGLARGYLNNPTLTAERFLPNPFVRGEKIYRTGDRARWLPDGTIEFLGRIDHQIKIRGYRIELGEIENSLLAHGEIQDAVVISRPDEQGVDFLVGYFVGKGEGEISQDEIRHYLANRLPEYMIPTYLIQLDRVPTNQHGKVDRSALPEPMKREMSNTYHPPRTKTEIRLADLWAEVLDHQEPIGLRDHFFQLGGHSLKATLLTAKIQQALQVEVSLRDIFQRPTLEALVTYIDQLEERRMLEIPKAEKREYYPTTAAQKRLYIQVQFEGMGTSYNMPGAVFIEGPLNVNRIEEVFLQLIERHETLRTAFEMQDGEVVQKILDRVDFALENLDWDFDSTRFREDGQYLLEQGVQAVMDSLVRPFDLAQAPLIRAGVARLDESHHLLCFDLHHLISDGLSMNNLIREFIALYQGQSLPALKIQYKDVAVWQEKNQIGVREEEYWLERFTGDIPVLQFPTDQPRPSVQSFRGQRYDQDINLALGKELEGLALKTGTSMYMLMLAAYTVLLYKYTGQRDFIIGTPVAGRNHPDLEPLIGMFVNMLALRQKISGEQTFMSFLEEIREETLEALENQNYPFEKLVQELQLPRDLSRNPLFDVVFALQENRHTGAFTVDGLAFTPQDFTGETTKFDLTLEVVQEPQRLWFSLEYATDLFTRERMSRLAGHYLQILSGITKNPEQSIGTLEILSPMEKQQIIEGFNATEMAFPQEETLQQLFIKQVQRTPDQIALVYTPESWGIKENRPVPVTQSFDYNQNGEANASLAKSGLEMKWTYREVNDQVNILAHQLRESGVRREDLVAILGQRSPEMILGILAVLKAGGAYLPIDPQYPPERIDYMLTDSGATYLLTQADLPEQLNFSGMIISLEMKDDHEEKGCPEPENLNTPQDLAYVIYTSGSTGKPKGVMIEHRSVINLTTYYQKQFQLQGKNILHTSQVSFDTSVVEIFPPLMGGGTIYIVPQELALDQKRLLPYMEEKQIHFAQFVPVALQEILGQTIPPASLETVIVGGDALDDRLKDQMLEQGYPLYNHYGPTESTVDAVTTHCAVGKSGIGRPIANTQVYILDADGGVAPVGVKGELCIGGVGLARGYLHRPELTAERFVPHPFRSGARIYRTGDQASWQEDGSLLFHGRLDQQVKIRGYRIEPGEIEKSLLKEPEITGAVVIARKDQRGEKELYAYFTASSDLSVSALRQALNRQLPDYMVPVGFMQLAQFPLTPNGKIDRRGLPEPEGKGNVQGFQQPPSNEVEERLLTIWEELLEVEGIGINHNFFELGGHSLKAMQLINIMEQEWQIRLSLVDFFQSPTVKGLAELLLSQKDATYRQIVPLPVQDFYELSYQQQRIWFITQRHPDSRAYHMAGQLEITDSIEPTMVQEIFRQLMQRHESLRTRFQLVTGRVVQVIEEGVKFDLPIHDLSDLEKSAKEQAQREIFQDIASTPFDLTRELPIRATLVKRDEDNWQIIFCMHHIVSDGWSIEILKRDFYALYQAYGEETKPLQPLPIQYKDFAAWQLSLLENDTEMEKARNYWSEKLGDGFPLLNLPQDYAHNLDQQEQRGGAYRAVISAEVKKKLLEVATTNNTSLFAVLSTLLATFLSELTGQKRIGIGFPSFGRRHQSLKNVIGFFVNTLVMVVDVKEATTFEEQLQVVNDDLIQALQYQDYPLELIVDELGVKYPQIQVFFNLLNLGQSHKEKLTDFSSHHLQDAQHVKFDWMLYLAEYANGIELICTYNARRYKPDTIEYVIEEYIGSLKQAMGESKEEDVQNLVDDDFMLLRGE